ncbi:MAG: hypothetical protein KAS71_11250 [Bacteroidales bacterium]|nr:hypothetical protein [Bacteroidales bacterium]
MEHQAEYTKVNEELINDLKGHKEKLGKAFRIFRHNGQSEVMETFKILDKRFDVQIRRDKAFANLMEKNP